MVDRPGQQRIPVPPGFDLVRELGRGGCGIVMLARHRALDRLVAVKGILGGAGVGSDELERFRREGRVLAGLTHPAVVRVYDLLPVGNDLALVMEYVPGVSLADRIELAPLPVAEALVVLGDVADALDCAAGHDIAHRDVKPANVFVLPTGRAKLGDFGLARITGDLTAFRTSPGAVLGTPAYMAPEQIRGDTDADSGCDAYSFAVMTYQVMTGHLPYPVQGGLAMLAAHLTAEPIPPQEFVPGFPPAATAALLGGLDKDPARRSTPSQLIAALRAVPAHEWPPPTALPPARNPAVEPGGETVRFVPQAGESSAPQPRSVGWFRRRRRFLWAVALAVAVLTAFVAVRLSRDGSQPLRVQDVTVAVAPDGGRAACPAAEYRFTGSVRTNGGEGVVRLRWTEPDGSLSAVTTVPVGRDADRVDNVLRFEVKGDRPFQGSAVLHVLEPSTVDSAPVGIRYDC